MLFIIGVMVGAFATFLIGEFYRDFIKKPAVSTQMTDLDYVTSASCLYEEWDTLHSHPKVLQLYDRDGILLFVAPTPYQEWYHVGTCSKVKDFRDGQRLRDRFDELITFSNLMDNIYEAECDCEGECGGDQSGDASHDEASSSVPA